jgi:predicted Zn-ribbon and HTH transcriptional regulator
MCEGCRIIKSDNLTLDLLYSRCPVCGHDWIAHFAMIDCETKELVYPYPATCMDCGTCNYVLDLVKE